MRHLYRNVANYLKISVFWGITLILQYKLLIASDGIRLMSQLTQLKQGQEFLVNKLVLDHQRLDKSYRLLQSDPQELEHQARVEWRMVLPKEKVFPINEIVPAK